MAFTVYSEVRVWVNHRTESTKPFPDLRALAAASAAPPHPRPLCLTPPGQVTATTSPRASAATATTGAPSSPRQHARGRYTAVLTPVTNGMPPASPVCRPWRHHNSGATGAGPDLGACSCQGRCLEGWSVVDGEGCVWVGGKVGSGRLRGWMLPLDGVHGGRAGKVEGSGGNVLDGGGGGWIWILEWVCGRIERCQCEGHGVDR